MTDALHDLHRDLLAAGFPGCETFADRVEKIFAAWNIREETILKAQGRIKVLQAEIQEKNRQIKKLNKMHFGSKADLKSDRLAPSLADEEKAEELLSQETVDEKIPVDSPKLLRDLKAVTPRTSRGRGPKNYGSGHERRTEFIVTDDKLCPCGCGGSVLGYDENEVLECISAQFYIKVTKLARYRCRLKDKIVGTPFPPKIVSQTGMSASFTAHIINMRYGWHLPWHRQSDRVFSGAGLNIQRSTLMRWSTRVALDVLRPIHKILCDELVLNGIRILVDETTVPRLAPGNGKTKTSYVYAVHRDDSTFAGNLPPGVAYYSRSSRSMSEIQGFLKGCTAIVQHDGYGGYGFLGKLGTPFEKVTSVECWAHARRFFTDEVEFNGTKDAATIIDLQGELYHVEKSIRGEPAGVRVAVRKQKSVPILSRIKSALLAFESRHLPKSGMGRAIQYMLRRWESLTQFVNNGCIDLDTNTVERMFKPIILSRKNVMFIGSDEGGEAWAVHSSLAETCRLNGRDFEKYLTWVFEQVIQKKPRSEYADLLPWNSPNHCRLDFPKGIAKI